LGRDLVSETEIGNFILYVERDHKGFYTGNQARIYGEYSCYHYHISHSSLTQIQIMEYLEDQLKTFFSAKRIPNVDSGELGIGYIHKKPERYSLWEVFETHYSKKLGKFIIVPIKNQVLWIGQIGKLHIEANKITGFEKAILKKKELMEILKDWKD
jgi:hypothetical protein